MRKHLVTGVVALWLAIVGTGLALVTRYKGTAGVAADAPSTWPEDSRIPRAHDRATLIMLAHPRCSCTRASIGELAELMERVGSRVDAHVLFIHPEGTTEDWDKTDTWRSASAIPGVHVVRDEDGSEARRFGAATSGQTLVYDARGRLVFRGGITPARGHAGTSVGRERIATLVLGERTTEAPVFGCSLHERTQP